MQSLSSRRWSKSDLIVPSSLWRGLGFVPRLVSDPKVTMLRTRIFQSLIFLLSLQSLQLEIGSTRFVALEATRRGVAHGAAGGAGLGRRVVAMT